MARYRATVKGREANREIAARYRKRIENVIKQSCYDRIHRSAARAAQLEEM